jgi:OmpA-OmpF porin, OOP family
MRIVLMGGALLPALVWAQPPARRTADLDVTSRLEAPAVPPGDDAAVPTVDGPAGLLRMRTTEVGPPGSFRLALHTEMFTKSDFLVAGDEDTRFIGTLVLAGTPFSWLEAFFVTRSSSNENTARRKQDDDVILALGDFGFGAKGRAGGDVFSAGPEFNVRFLNAVGGTSPNLSATNLYLGGVASLDPTQRGFPVRAHLDLGFQWDQSRELCPTGTGGLCDSTRFTNPIERMVEEFGQGMNRNRFEIALGLDVPFETGGLVRLRPIVEYHLEYVTGDPDDDYSAKCATDAAFGQICGLGRDSQVLLLGFRGQPARGLFLDLGVDIGLASPGAEFGPAPAVPPWNVVLGLAYAHDPRVAVRVVERPRAGGRDHEVGRVRGVVLDEKTQDPVEGAVVVFTGRNVTGLSTDPDGGFLSYEFPPGPLGISVRHPKYETAKADVVLSAGKDVPLEIRLKPAANATAAAAPGNAALSGHVTDAGGKPVQALLRIQGPTNAEVSTDAAGAFSTALPPGDYTARFEAADFAPSERAFHVDEGASQTLDVVLAKKSASSHVQIAGDRIVLRGKVHFGTRDARLRADSGQLLDEIAELLSAHPEIARVRIEGHTDNRGAKAQNQKLSQDRADAVRSYLIEHGVAADRLEAMGYGASRPLVPNLGVRNREKNRRVELRIVNN